MADLLRHGWALFIICLALLAQAIGPTAFAATASARLEAGLFFCAPSGAATAESRAAVEDLVSSLGDRDAPQPLPAEHCAACLLASSAPLPASIGPGRPVFVVVDVAAPVRDSLSAPKPAGPPLGQRGPPLFH